MGRLRGADSNESYSPFDFRMINLDLPQKGRWHDEFTGRMATAWFPAFWWEDVEDQDFHRSTLLINLSQYHGRLVYGGGGEDEADQRPDSTDERPGWVKTAGWLVTRTPETALLGIAGSVPLGRAGDIETAGLAPSLDLHSPAHARGIYTSRRDGRTAAPRNGGAPLHLRERRAQESVEGTGIDSTRLHGVFTLAVRVFGFIRGSSDRCCLRLVPPITGLHASLSRLVHAYFPIPRRGCTYIAHTCVSVPLGYDAASTSSSVLTCPRPVSAFPPAPHPSRFVLRLLTPTPKPTPRDSSGTPSCPTTNCPSPAADPGSAHRCLSISPRPHLHRPPPRRLELAGGAAGAQGRGQGDALGSGGMGAAAGAGWQPVRVGASAGGRKGALFLGTGWINIPALWSFLEARDRDDSERNTIVISSSPEPPPPLYSRGKRESAATNLALKSEPGSAPLPFRTRSRTEGGREVTELLSDSEEEGPAISLMQNADRDVRSRAPDLSDADSDTRGALQESDTVWLDSHVSSMVGVFRASFTSDARTYVDHMEYLTEIPSVLPVPTAYVFDLSAAKFNLVDSTHLIPVDGLVKSKVNDSWTGNSGTGDPAVDVTFVLGEPKMACRRSRTNCKGCHVCSAVDPVLMEGDQYELSVTSWDAIFDAQRETRTTEGETPDQRATAYFPYRHHVLQRIATVGFVAADPSSKRSHRGRAVGIIISSHVMVGHWNLQSPISTHVIPDNVDETLLEKLFANKPLANDKSVDTKPCSRIVHPHIGGKLRFCGEVTPTSSMVALLLIVLSPPFHPEGVAHNHPIPPLKLSYGSNQTYRECAAAVGLIGSTVAKVDNGINFFDSSILSPTDNPAASSTQLLLHGQIPGQFTPALQESRLKRDIIREEKKKIYPAGLGIPGASQLYHKDLTKPIDERYIYRFQHTPGGGLIIFTCFTALLTLLDDTGVKAFEDDTTFKRIQGNLNEWEVVIFYSAPERAITPARAYINRSDTKFFELLFDMIREIKIETTGRDIGFARFMPDGNLLVMNADMEAAQALGAVQSVMKTNLPSFSGITTLDPHLFPTFFIKFCGSHATRWEIPIPTWRLNANCFYISPLQASNWWAHREMDDWVIPCLVKSQSNILPEHWDGTLVTTNTGETQPYWTNSLTGIQLTLVNGIESACQIDWNVVNEVRTSTTSDILGNSNNEMFHWLGRNSQRQSAAAHKSRESTRVAERKAEIKAKIKDFTAELKSLNGTSTARSNAEISRKTSDDTDIVSASSCGRVKTLPLPKRTTKLSEMSLCADEIVATPVVEIARTPAVDTPFPVDVTELNGGVSAISAAFTPFFGYTSDLDFDLGLFQSNFAPTFAPEFSESLRAPPPFLRIGIPFDSAGSQVISECRHSSSRIASESGSMTDLATDILYYPLRGGLVASLIGTSLFQPLVLVRRTRGPVLRGLTIVSRAPGVALAAHFYSRDVREAESSVNVYIPLLTWNVACPAASPGAMRGRVRIEGWIAAMGTDRAVYCERERANEVSPRSAAQRQDARARAVRCAQGHLKDGMRARRANVYTVVWFDALQGRRGGVAGRARCVPVWAGRGRRGVRTRRVRGAERTAGMRAHLILQDGILYDGKHVITEVQFFFRAEVNGAPEAFALVDFYSDPWDVLLEESHQTVWSCGRKVGAHLSVIPVKSILSVVAMIPHKIEEDDDLRYFLVEKPGLDVISLAGYDEVDDEADGIYSSSSGWPTSPAGPASAQSPLLNRNSPSSMKYRFEDSTSGSHGRVMIQSATTNEGAWQTTHNRPGAFKFAIVRFFISVPPLATPSTASPPAQTGLKCLVNLLLWLTSHSLEILPEGQVDQKITEFVGLVLHFRIIPSTLIVSVLAGQEAYFLLSTSIPQIFHLIPNPMNVKVPPLSLSTADLPIENPTITTLLQSDYPDVKSWNRKDYSDSDLTRISDDEHRKLGFLEHEDGTIFNKEQIASVRKHIRAAFQSLLDDGLAPQTWSSASSKATSRVRTEMLAEFPALSFCANHWKVDAVATEVYSQWSSSRRDAIVAAQGKSNKRKHKSHGESSSSAKRAKPDDDSQEPRRKKKIAPRLRSPTISPTSDVFIANSANKKIPPSPRSPTISASTDIPTPDSPFPPLDTANFSPSEIPPLPHLSVAPATRPSASPEHVPNTAMRDPVAPATSDSPPKNPAHFVQIRNPLTSAFGNKVVIPDRLTKITDLNARQSSGNTAVSSSIPGPTDPTPAPPDATTTKKRPHVPGAADTAWNFFGRDYKITHKSDTAEQVKPIQTQGSSSEGGEKNGKGGKRSGIARRDFLKTGLY
ncbi:hypothetical protein DFH09DRAFT_1086398 [Mycena vulgaris]|nr:hypothetical protein DFH09DRAFT_1086398 [Mycena vulgaris]